MPLSPKHRVAIVTALTAVTLVIALTPGLGSIIRDIPGVSGIGGVAVNRLGDEPLIESFVGPLPDYGPLHNTAIRRAARVLPAGSYYYVSTESPEPLVKRMVEDGARLYLYTSIGVQKRRGAEWILRYGSPLPRSREHLKTYRLGSGLSLVELRRNPDE